MNLFRTVTCNGKATGVWLGKEADESTKVPPALIRKTLKGISKKHLDTVQITYDSRDEINLLGNGTIRGTDWQKRLSYLMTKESVTFLSGKGEKPELIDAAFFNRVSGKLVLKLVTNATIEYRCQESPMTSGSPSAAKGVGP